MLGRQRQRHRANQQKSDEGDGQVGKYQPLWQRLALPVVTKVQVQAHCRGHQQCQHTNQAGSREGKVEPAEDEQRHCARRRESVQLRNPRRRWPLGAKADEGHRKATGEGHGEQPRCRAKNQFCVQIGTFGNNVDGKRLYPLERVLPTRLNGTSLPGDTPRTAALGQRLADAGKQ
jgi:hypothetical protein